MATGKVVTAHFFPATLTGTISNLGSHQSGGCAISSATVTINGVNKGTWTSSLYSSDYLFLPRYYQTGQQHFLLEALYPNNTSGNVIVVWNQSDNTLSGSFDINGFLIPKALCQSTADSTYYKPFLFKEYGASSSISVPAREGKDITGADLSYSVPTNYRAFGILDMKSGSTNCVIRRIEPYISDSSSTVMSLYNYSTSASSAIPTVRFIFVNSIYMTYV